ncbi:MAG: preprotein translocase subunit YajC [Candidatus Abyssobacteria bacterium SURF_5]|uniref:Sec translocon accessory complex subunit YajC n=1 Tax=Abyssobacteria bacterium (strain SURF_5) TaxID=2093360 RepID=A0A3A4P4N5_ABYX5|nr:MAG: preprotein translocase subunit YajC [Candidatus Abyssubacteria bacterium SURF_5]
MTLGLFQSLAYAQGNEGGVTSPIGGFLFPLILMFIIFYFLLIRPQSRKQKQHQEMLRNLKKGDKVITSGGLYGVVVKVSEKDVIIEVAEKVNLRFTLGAIATVREREETEKKGS